MRKTDDEVIIKMLKDGRSQKDIAKHFNVSPAYICKRIKRLQVIDPPESFKNLTEKQARFCLEKAEGKTATQAVLNSYEVTSKDSAKVIGSQLMSNPTIQTAISDLMELHGADLSTRIKKLSTHIFNRDPSVSLRALDLSFKLNNDFPPTKNINLNKDVPIQSVMSIPDEYG